MRGRGSGQFPGAKHCQTAPPIGAGPPSVEQSHCPWAYAQSSPSGMHACPLGTLPYVAGHVPVTQPPVCGFDQPLDVHVTTALHDTLGLSPYSHSMPIVEHAEPADGCVAGHPADPPPLELVDPPELDALPLDDDAPLLEELPLPDEDDAPLLDELPLLELPPSPPAPPSTPGTPPTSVVPPHAPRAKSPASTKSLDRMSRPLLQDWSQCDASDKCAR